METVRTTCVIAGGGPAGMMLGLLLARNGVDVVVLEKHADFFRDFRGDTIHPSTVGVLGELGLRDAFLGLPHTGIRTLDVVVNGNRLHPIDFGRLGAPDDFLVLAPQWDFLTFLAQDAARHPNFRLLMETEATDLVREGDVVRGVLAQGPDGPLEIRARLVVAADGRDSVLRAAAGLRPRRTGVPIDVLWFRLPKPEGSSPHTLAYIGDGGMVVTIERQDYVQAGLIIPKGGFDGLRESGLEAFREAVAGAAPHLRASLETITEWDQVKLLSVQIDRLPRWFRRGFLAIGDAAHAMSPAFGVGVNYAIQDAVATANALTATLRELGPAADAREALTADAAGEVDLRLLEGIQRRRTPPVAAMQRIQLAAHRFISRPEGVRLLPHPLPAPLRLALAAATPVVQMVSSRLIGRGLRPESVAPELR
ncbi:FAD-dependent oxidoreductase [Leifsonia shinshuensis]|uniref:FAD-dependent oxidoreductase n=1 Tax=Leifsonia shinshuensis TaxID=150026 RepID=UPI002857A251|nr:FAD-dependent oxidoreductase [Leifsonia shinshuensis]MDR6972468.1 2-polyprenyl-6-methoxyphenol hydroxylase-like FAD-dependent oxidoreductase [Leifsonia shinshuensis]